MRRRDDDEDGEWRCESCGQMLGRLLSGGRVHLMFGRRDYIAATPAMCRCPKCRTINETEAPYTEETWHEAAEI